MNTKGNHLPTIHNPRYKALIKELISLRKSMALKQEDLAKILGLTQPDVSKIERFERRLDALELLDWLEAVGVSVEKTITLKSKRGK